MSSVFQITAVAFSTFLKRLAAAVRSRTAANGDSTGFDVRRCFQCSWGELGERHHPLPVMRQRPDLILLDISGWYGFSPFASGS